MRRGVSRTCSTAGKREASGSPVVQRRVARVQSVRTLNGMLGRHTSLGVRQQRLLNARAVVHACLGCDTSLPWLRQTRWPCVVGGAYVRCGAVWCSAPLANVTGNPLMAVEDLQRRQSCGAVCDQGQAAKPTWRHFATGTKSPKVFNLNLVYWASARVLKEARRGEFAEQ